MTEAELRKALLELGPRSSSVASRLCKARAKGYPNNSLECPVSQYVHRLTNFTFDWVMADVNEVAVGRGDGDRLVADIVVTTPAPVAEFMNRFDLGSYRFLRANR